MRRIFILGLILLPFLLTAQSKIKPRKYPSLLWEITGNGLQKPSYLFGTMHVSSKLAFHLADSFFLGIRNADVVALETNPESWQEDMSNYEMDYGYRNYSGYTGSNYVELPNEYLRLNTLRFYKYDKKIARALYSNPSAINNLLYRSYGNESSDFEEDTYLDMYIYQCGKKWGKKVAGVEKYAESMKLMMEAYKDAAKDRQIKERSYDSENSYSFNKLQEAYRSGNLDWLDSINKYNSFSPAFDEKFLYRRNEIQASSIDSILRSGQSLFVGVGAAHLPGNRGVIEILRDQGYKLRPVKMGARDSQHKNQVEKVRVPVKFSTQVADDSLFKVSIPGKFYKFGEDPSLDQRQYADMANGSYYMVTRILTNGWMWGHSSDKVYTTIDSLLYENIPGRIISRQKITRNGYKGIDLTNKTRRGDVQRYNIFVMPFEVVIFKMSGTGDYVLKGEEASKFFGSIQLKGYTSNATTKWKTYSPPYGGFAVELPHTPHVSNDGSWIFDAEDPASRANFRVIRTDIHNYNFAEEDSFDLELMAESFESSEFVDKAESHRAIIHQGYPALDGRYKAKNGSVFLTRFIIQGPHYYTLVAYGQKETTSMKKFLESFVIKPYNYDNASARHDTSLYFTVNSPVFPTGSKEKLGIPRFNDEEEDESSEDTRLEDGAFRSTVIEHDSTGEKIYVSFFKMPRYQQVKDSTKLENESPVFFSDSSGIVRNRKNFELPGGIKVWETVLTDTGSSRTIWSKTYYKNGIGYALMTQSDTLSKPSLFVKTFFESFQPVDSLKGLDPFAKKSKLFFDDFMSDDTTIHKRAVKGIHTVRLDSADLPQLKAIINSLDWKEKKYLEVKKDLVGKLDGIKTKASSDFLRQLYYAAGDTVELQYKVLETLLEQQTSYAFSLFRGIMENDPPVLETNSGRSRDLLDRYYRDIGLKAGWQSPGDDGFLGVLRDSLQLTAGIFQGLLPLINIDDYKAEMMSLLAELIDSNLVHKNDYDFYFSKFLVEARQELKKQSIAEKRKAIERAEKEKLDSTTIELLADDADSLVNEKLDLYTVLLMPYWDTNPAVKIFFNQVFSTNDKRLKYNTMMLMIRNGKPFNDSLPNYFAAMDAYRYGLFTDLEKLGKQNLFPAKFKDHVEMAKSRLLYESWSEKPDSLLFLQKLPASVKNKKGFIYFFKYKSKKDDAFWKLASVGLVPDQPGVYKYQSATNSTNDYPSYRSRNIDPIEYTAFSDTRINDETSLDEQLRKELKRLLYSRRKSAREFYDKSDGNPYAGISINYDEN